MSGPTLNAQHARALTFIALDIRAATIGARAWDEHGTFMNIMKREGQNLAIVAQDVIRHAARVDAKTPGVIAGSFNPPEVVAVKTKRGNPHRGEDCPRHPGQWPDNCAGCTTDANPVTRKDPPVADAVRETPLSPNLAAKLAKFQPPTEETPDE